MISLESPRVFVSICIPVIPFLVEVTLKSMPPAPSSRSCRSVRTFHLFPSDATPIAMPATCLFSGTPASMRDRVEPQVLAIEEEPLLPITSLTTLIVYGNSSSSGRTGFSAFSASAPWPISLLPAPLRGFTSPTE